MSERGSLPPVVALALPVPPIDDEDDPSGVPPEPLEPPAPLVVAVEARLVGELQAATESPKVTRSMRVRAFMRYCPFGRPGPASAVADRS